MTITIPNESTIATLVAAIVAMIGGFVAITADQQAALIQGAVLIVLAVLGYLQTSTAVGKVEALTEPAKATAAIVATLPPRSYLMSDDTKRWIISAESLPDQQLILQQVASSEAAHLVSYQIQYSRGYYNIEYGLIKSSARS